MFKVLIILVVLMLACIGVIVWSCIYVGGQADKIYLEAEFERPDFIQMEERE